MRNIFRKERAKTEHLPVSKSMPEGRSERIAGESSGAASGSLGRSLIRMLEPKTIYPYAVIRYMYGCYGAFPIEFLSNELQQPKYEDSWSIVMPNPYKNGKLTSEARQAVLDITEVSFNQMQGRNRMCAVFAEDDCVRFELDGRRVKDNSPPSMTINLTNASNAGPRNR